MFLSPFSVFADTPLAQPVQVQPNGLSATHARTDRSISFFLNGFASIFDVFAETFGGFTGSKAKAHARNHQDREKLFHRVRHDLSPVCSFDVHRISNDNNRELFR